MWNYPLVKSSSVCRTENQGIDLLAGKSKTATQQSAQVSGQVPKRMENIHQADANRSSQTNTESIG